MPLARGVARRRTPLRARPALALALLAALIAPLSGCARPAAPPAAWDPDSIPDAFARSTGALMWPGLPRAFLVDEHGALTNGLWRAVFDCRADSLAAPGPLRVACQDRWRPVLRWNRRAGAALWQFEAVAFPARFDGDSVLAVSVRLRATNTGAVQLAGRLTARFDTLDAEAPFVAAEGEAPRGARLRWSAGGADSACGWSRDAGPDGTVRLEIALAPGESRTMRFVMASHLLRAGELAACARSPHDERVRQVASYWDAEVAQGTQFALGDGEVENALRGARVVVLACRQRYFGSWFPIGGPFQYRDVWLRDGARLVQALAITGRAREARELADGLSTLQWPQGPFLTQWGQLDGTGQALWAFEQAMLRPEADSSAARFARRALVAVRWIEMQREFSRRAGGAFAGFLPYADPRDAELVRAQLPGNDAWAIAGYRAAARLCGAAGMREDSAQVETLRTAYRRDFLAALERTRSRDVPASWQGGGRDWGNFAAVWPAQVIAAGDARAERLARRAWAAVGGAGLTSYGPADTLQSYVGVDLAVASLLADRPAPADSVLAALLHWRNASGAGAELFSRSSRDFGADLPPHPTTAAALIALVRNSIVFDDGDSLLLTLGARERWWHGSRVSRAPTRWGTIDVTFRRTGNRAEWTWTPVPVWSVLRVPPGTRIASLRGAPAAARAAGAHFVVMPPRSSSATVALEREP